MINMRAKNNGGASLLYVLEYPSYKLLSNRDSYIGRQSIPVLKRDSFSLHYYTSDALIIINEET